MGKGHGRHRCVPAQRRFERFHERREFWIHPEFVVEALLQNQAWRQAPGELRKHLVLLVCSGQRWIGTRLAIVVAQVLVAPEKPEPIAHGRASEVCREITVPDPFVTTLLPTRTLIDQLNRLAGECRGLTVIRRVVGKAVASLPGDDIDHCALNVAKFGGGACGLNLNFLNEVNARLGASLSTARTREVRAIDQKPVLVGAGTEYGHAVARGAPGRGGRYAWRDSDEVEHAEPSRRDGLEIVALKASLEPTVARFDARA